MFHGGMLPQIYRLFRLRWLVREDKKFRDLDDMLNELTDGELNNATYRKKFGELFDSEKRKHEPLLPYMPLITKDLEKMDRLLLKKDKNDETQVNLCNLRKHCLIIKALIVCQQRSRYYRDREPIVELQQKLRQELEKAKPPHELKQLSVEVE